MQQPVEDRRRDASVVVKDARPVLIRLVGRDDERAAFVALTDDLEEQVGPGFIQRQVRKWGQAVVCWFSGISFVYGPKRLSRCSR